ncbi:MAG: redoxin domain-containing protein [Bradymonadaceae bacterium]
MPTLKWMLIGLLVGGLTVACDNDKPAPEAAEAQAAEESEAEEASELVAGEGAPGAAGEEEAAKPSDKPLIGKVAPDFTLVDEAGKSHTLSDYKGKFVVLEWFNIPCPYVVRHYKERTFDNIIEEVGADNIVWLAIDTTHDNKPEDSLKWKAAANENRKHDYPILQDPDGTVGRLYEAKTTPHMFVIDRAGVLRYMGGIDDDVRGRKDVAERTPYVLDALKALEAGEEVSQTTATPYGCTVKYKDS